MEIPPSLLTDTSWQGVYARTQWLYNNAPTPELRTHFGAELTNIEIVLGIKPPGTPLTGHVFNPPKVGSVVTDGPAPWPPPKFPIYTAAPAPVQPKPGQGTTLSLKLPPELEVLRPYILQASRDTGVPANLIAAMIWDESRGNPKAFSVNANGQGDTGLMQINSATFTTVILPRHPELAYMVGHLGEPRFNILAGAYHMADLYKDFGGNWELALRAYNSGPLAVDPNSPPNFQIPGTAGTWNYVEKVMNYWNILDSGGTLPP